MNGSSPLARVLLSLAGWESSFSCSTVSQSRWLVLSYRSLASLSGVDSAASLSQNDHVYIADTHAFVLVSVQLVWPSL